jgi:hypothetical protein
MFMTDFAADKMFEDEVRRVARQLWPGAELGAAASVDGKERDGIFETEDVLHLIECTTSQKMDKAVSDSEKLSKLARKLAPRDFTKAVKCWFITREEPTVDQRTAVKKHQGLVVAMGFEQFRSKLVDIRSYLSTRDNYPFGSVRDLDSGKADLELKHYIPLDMVDTDDLLWSYDALKNAISQGKRFALLGDYGAGKSSTMGRIFKDLANLAFQNKTFDFPVMLNLRDHQGQKDPAEALERHAKAVGFHSPAHLVRAWRAGYVTLLLDGFDEIASAGWTGTTKKLRDLRYKSMELVRQFLRQTPGKSGILVTGRAHFFDDLRELRTALGLDSAWATLNLNEFTAEQVQEFLKKRGWTEAVPDWLPSRPLLLGYLAARNLLEDTIGHDYSPTPAAGWHNLLDRICKRESEIEVGVEPDTIRRIIERLATLARQSSDGLGPLLPEQVVQAFTEVVGQPPDDRGLVLIQRLPGLGINVGNVASPDAFNAQDGSRRFIDQSFADSAAAGDVFHYIHNPHGCPVDASGWASSLQPMGIDVLACRCSIASFAAGKLAAAMTKTTAREKQDALCADIARALIALDFSYQGPKLYIRDAVIPELMFDIDSQNLSELEFQEAIIKVLALSPSVPASNLPIFVKCFIQEFEGRTSQSDLPATHFIKCDIDSFENAAATNTEILRLDLPPGGKVLLTILRKLYLQKGRGRRENALSRGLDLSDRGLVPEVLKALRREGFVTQARYTDQCVWLPIRAADKRQRAHRILGSPHQCTDSLLIACSKIR